MGGFGEGEALQVTTSLGAHGEDLFGTKGSALSFARAPPAHFDPLLSRPGVHDVGDKDPGASTSPVRVHRDRIPRRETRPPGGAHEVSLLGGNSTASHTPSLTPLPSRQSHALAWAMAFAQPLPQALSPSRLQDFQSCPRRYQLGAVERVAQPATYATTKGRLVHHVLEHLHQAEPAARTAPLAHELTPGAFSAILTDEVRRDLDGGEEVEERLHREVRTILERYFEVEDPREVDSEGIELTLRCDIEGTPLLGILDRLDRDENGDLVIIDYKTGRVPSRHFDQQTFANAELYALLCREALGETPSAIRLIYVAHAEELEKPVRDVVVSARAHAAQSAWSKIVRYYEAGEFPATPSTSACRWCAFRDRCRADGVAVPEGL